MALAAILAVALAVRLPMLDSSLWYDEIITIVNFARLPLGQLVRTFDSLNNHMLYSILAHASFGLFGEHAWSARLPALMFGLASVVTSWLLARRALAPWPALLVALLVALSYHHVWFSQNARGYTMLLFFTSASLLALLDGLERPRWRSFVLFAILAALAIYTHLSAGFFYAALGLAALATGVNAARQGRTFPWLHLIVSGTLALVLAFLLHLPIITQAVTAVHTVSTKTASSGHALAEWQNPLRAVQEIGNSLAGTTPLIPVLVAAAALVLVVGAAALARRQPLILLTFAIHIPLTMLLLRLLSFRIWPRYFFTELGFIFLLVVLGVVTLSQWAARRIGWPAPRLTALAAIATVAVSLVLLPRNYSAPKQDYTSARDWVEQHLQPGDKVGATGLAAVAYDRYYRPGWHEANSLDQLHGLRASARTTWILISFPHQTRSARAEVAAELDRDFDRVATFPGTLGDGAIWVYRSRGNRG